MKKMLELVHEVIFQSFLMRHVQENLKIISLTRPEVSRYSKLEDKYAPGYNRSEISIPPLTHKML
jgi:hypothetical protein